MLRALLRMKERAWPQGLWAFCSLLRAEAALWAVASALQGFMAQ